MAKAKQMLYTQEGYDALVARDGRRVRRVDASRSIEDVFETVRGAVDALLDE